MAYEIKDGSGSLFANTKKESDNHPDYRGDAKINGKMFEIAGWKKKTKTGATFLSLSIKPKRETVHEPDPLEDDDDF